MDLDIFTLCDGAYNYNGKLTLVGTYDQIVINNIPQTFRSSLAVKIKFLPDDIKNDTVFSVNYLDNQNNLIGNYKINIPKPPVNANHLTVALAINKDLKISTSGEIRIQLLLDNDNLLIEKKVQVRVVNSSMNN